MNIVVPVKFVPDLVEELTIDSSGKALDMSWLRQIINETDDHAIEQAILLKEQYGGQVTVISPEAEGVDDMFFATAAKGSDRHIKLLGDFSQVNNHGLARAMAATIKELKPELILTGVQANNDLDGPLGSILASYLEITYIGYVSGVKINGQKAIVRKEYPGGLIAEMEVPFPAVLGIQAAEQPPRYVAISKVRQMMKTTVIEEKSLDEPDNSGGPIISRMFTPEATGKATMLTGDIDAIAEQIVNLFKELGVI